MLVRLQVGVVGFLIALAAFTVQAEVSTDVVCTWAPSKNATVNRITSAVGGAGVGVAAIMQAAGFSAVAHSSGMYILTGSGGYIAGTIGGAIVAPILVTASVATAAGVITLELTCAPKNHPEAVRSVKKVTEEFIRATNGKLDSVQTEALKQVRELNSKGIDMREDTAGKIRAANNVAIEIRDNALGYFNK